MKKSYKLLIALAILITTYSGVVLLGKSFNEVRVSTYAITNEEKDGNQYIYIGKEVNTKVEKIFTSNEKFKDKIISYEISKMPQVVTDRELNEDEMNNLEKIFIENTYLLAICISIIAAVSYLFFDFMLRNMFIPVELK